MTKRMSDFYLIDRAGECCSRPWAVPSSPLAEHWPGSMEQYDRIMSGKDFDINLSFWLDRRTSGKLSDMPYCDGAMFVVSPRMHKVLSPFFGDTVTSRKIDICSESKGDVGYHILSIKQGAGEQDLFRGSSLFIVSGMRKFRDLNLKIENAYGIFFDASTWTGADIFRLGPNGNQMIVTEQVAQAVSAAGLVGVVVTRLDTHEIEEWEKYVETGKHRFLF